MQMLLQIALGGALGAILRFGSVQMAVRLFGLGTPVGTAGVNIVGSFLMGLAAAWFAMRIGEDKLAPFIMIGVLGGFTTLSAFSLDALVLWEQGRQLASLSYVLVSVLGSILALFAGLLIVRGLLA